MRCIFIVAIVAQICIFAQDIVGTSQPFLEIEMVPLQPGTISSIKVKEGDFVKKGQIVAELDSNFLRPSLDIAVRRAENQGEIIAARSQLELARNKLKTIQELQKRNHARTAELEKTKAEVSLAEANLRITEEKNKVAKLEVRQIEFQITQHRVTSPVDGVVRNIIKKVGESISGTQPLIKLVQLHKINIEAFPLFEQAVGLRVGNKIRVFFPQTKQSVIAEVTFIDPVVDFASNTVRIVAVVNNRENKYRSGLKCFLNLRLKN